MDNLKTPLRKILEDFYKHATGFNDYGCKECNQALSSILSVAKVWAEGCVPITRKDKNNPWDCGHNACCQEMLKAIRGEG